MTAQAGCEVSEKKSFAGIDYTPYVFEDNPCGLEYLDYPQGLFKEPIGRVGSVTCSGVGPREPLAWWAGEHDEPVRQVQPPFQVTVGELAYVAVHHFGRLVICLIRLGRVAVDLDCETNGEARLERPEAHAASAREEVDSD